MCTRRLTVAVQSYCCSCVCLALGTDRASIAPACVAAGKYQYPELIQNYTAAAGQVRKAPNAVGKHLDSVRNHPQVLDRRSDWIFTYGLERTHLRALISKRRRPVDTAADHYYNSPVNGVCISPNSVRSFGVFIHCSRALKNRRVGCFFFLTFPTTPPDCLDVRAFINCKL